VGSDELRRRAAERAGARTEVLEGLGHWWMVHDPVRGAAALVRFWKHSTRSRLCFVGSEASLYVCLFHLTRNASIDGDYLPEDNILTILGTYDWSGM
jgi:hypothetical protein